MMCVISEKRRYRLVRDGKVPSSKEGLHCYLEGHSPLGRAQKMQEHHDVRVSPLKSSN